MIEIQHHNIIEHTVTSQKKKKKRENLKQLNQEEIQSWNGYASNKKKISNFQLGHLQNKQGLKKERKKIEYGKTWVFDDVGFLRWVCASL